MDPSAMSWGAGDAEQWKLRHDDDGFTYKISKRQRLLDPSAAAPPTVIDPKAEERHRKQFKRKILLKLKSRYQKEIDQWEILSNNLRAMQEKAKSRLELQNRQQHVGETSPSLVSPLAVNERSSDAYGLLIDELFSQTESQEAVIQDVSCLCNIAEVMFNAQQEWLAQLYMNLPVWSSPRKLMASLCDE